MASIARPHPKPTKAPVATEPAPDEEVPPPWDPVRIALVAAGVLLAITVLVWFVVAARSALVVVYIAALAAMAVAPAVALLENRTVPRTQRQVGRGAAVLLVYAVLVAIGFAVAVVILPTLLQQVSDLAGHAPQWVADAQTWLRERGIVRRELTVQELVERTPGGADALAAGILAIWGLVGSVLGFVAVTALSAYFVVEADTIVTTFARFFPRRQRLRIRHLARHIAEQVSAWVSGQLLIVGLVGATAAAGLFALGVPYFYVLAAICAAGELVPFVGPLVAAIPVIGVASTISWDLALAAAAFLLVQQQVEMHLITPRVMESRLGLSAATVIVALLVGETLLGVVGVLLAVPTAAILQVIVQELVPAFEER